MHPNQIFRQATQKDALQFASATGFGVLALNGEVAPMLAHVPFYIEGESVFLHLVRSNPIARAVKSEAAAKIIVNGPHGYVSPDWYGVPDQVPTWNYVAVHLEGTLKPLPASDLRGVIDRLSDQFEEQLLPKPVWKSAKVDPKAMAKLMRAIQPFRFQITSIDSTFKLNQNKSDAARKGAAEALRSSPVGSDTEKLSAMMTDFLSKDAP